MAKDIFFKKSWTWPLRCAIYGSCLVDRPYILSESYMKLPCYSSSMECFRASSYHLGRVLLSEKALGFFINC